MSRFVGSAGGFYRYIAAGLSRPVGVAGAFIALATYIAIELAVFGLFGFFVNEIVKTSGGPDSAWWAYGCMLAILIDACGRRNIMNHSDGTGGLVEFIAKDRPIENADIVLWRVFGIHHPVRLEDFPVQPGDQLAAGRQRGKLPGLTQRAPDGGRDRYVRFASCSTTRKPCWS